MKPVFLRSWTLKLILLVFTLNTLASFFYWYDIFPWFDNAMHFLGGLWIVVAVYSIFYPIIEAQKNKILRYLFVILWTLFIGLLWEVYEFSMQDLVQINNLASIPDSISDLVFDVLGGSAGYLLIKNKLKSYE